MKAENSRWFQVPATILSQHLTQHPTLERIQKVVESDESVVIHCWAPESHLRVSDVET